MYKLDLVLVLNEDENGFRFKHNELDYSRDMNS